MQWDRGLRILTNIHFEAWHSKYLVLMWEGNFGCGLYDYLIVYFFTFYSHSIIFHLKRIKELWALQYMPATWLQNQLP